MTSSDFLGNKGRGYITRCQKELFWPLNGISIQEKVNFFLTPPLSSVLFCDFPFHLTNKEFEVLTGLGSLKEQVVFETFVLLCIMIESLLVSIFLFLLALRSDDVEDVQESFSTEAGHPQRFGSATFPEVVWPHPTLTWWFLVQRPQVWCPGSAIAHPAL